MPLSERVYCVAVTFKMAERVGQQICIQFCVKLEHSSAQTIWMVQKAFSDDVNEYSANKSVAQTLQRWSRICSK